jgi:hypothetical protein
MRIQPDPDPNPNHWSVWYLTPLHKFLKSYISYIVFSFRKLTNEEEVCADICVSKHIAYNNKVNQRYKYIFQRVPPPPKKNIP